MVIIGVLVYFVLVMAALAWWLWPGLRERIHSGLGRALRGGRAAGREATLNASRAGGAGWGTLSHGTRRVSALLREHTRELLLALALLVVVPLAALVLRHGWALDGYDHTQSRDVNPQIAALLRGEQLVPPAALPPELFMTREVAQARPMASTANRQWELLDGDFRQRLLAVFKVMREQHGFEMALIEGFRSPQRQGELQRMGAHVTMAGPGESWHEVGLAADCAFLVGGRIVISETDPVAARGYALFGDVAQSVGLAWGGSWRSIKDLGHVELRRGGAKPS